MKAQNGYPCIPGAMKELVVNRKPLEISNLARKDLLANTAFHSADTSGITFTLVALTPVGGSNTKRVLRSGGGAHYF